MEVQLVLAAPSAKPSATTPSPRSPLAPYTAPLLPGPRPRYLAHQEGNNYLRHFVVESAASIVVLDPDFRRYYETKRDRSRAPC